jgi:GNAT superfamily N-acetyltransferase
MNDKVGQIETVITFLEMTSAPLSVPPRQPKGPIAIMRADPPTISFYRYLYNTIGADYMWWERRVMSDDALSAVIQDDNVDVYVLYVGGTPAGYYELLSIPENNDMEIAYFGIMPEFVGGGYGAYLLRVAIDEAWQRGPDRVIVNTCTLDHPTALPNYQRAGFEPYSQETRMIDDPYKLGLFD